MTVPARWIRRCVSPIAFVLISAASLAVFVATVVPLALISAVWSPARKALRLVVFAFVILGTELKALLAAFGLWLTRGGTEAHYRSLGRALHVLVRTASKLFALEPQNEVRDWPTDRLRRSNHALLVLCRHAGPGDSLILLDALINRYGLRPRLVMKSSMQLDPVVDVYFNRLPAAFVDPADTDGSAQRSIRRLAHDLGSDDTLVMFPEGGNYTPRRHRRAIRHLAEAGHHGDAARAHRLRNVMPPQPGGVLAVLDEVEEVDVLVVGHAGIGRIHSICDVWRSLEDRKLVALKAWFTPSEEVPADGTRRIGWLFDIWTTVDQWVETADDDDRHRHRPAARSEQDDDCPTSGPAI
jgi:1-acyl-sn-glycerol-3-phosphate acyltransferase